MHMIDEIYTRWPHYGYRRITKELQNRNIPANRKRVLRLMRRMGIYGIAPGPNLSKRDHQHHIYPYLLRGVKPKRPDHIWGIDNTYIRMTGGFMYLPPLRYNKLAEDANIKVGSSRQSETLTLMRPEPVQFSMRWLLKNYNYMEVQHSLKFLKKCFDNGVHYSASRIQAFIFNTERLLGAERGSLMCIMQVLGGSNEGSHE